MGVIIEGKTKKKIGENLGFSYLLDLSFICMFCLEERRGGEGRGGNGFGLSCLRAGFSVVKHSQITGVGFGSLLATTTTADRAGDSTFAAPAEFFSVSVKKGKGEKERKLEREVL